MKRVFFSLFGGWFFFSAMNSLPAYAEAEKNQRLDVVLFGQPCMLQGPLEKSVLQSIHSASPEQAQPPYEARFSAELTRTSVAKLKKVTGLPSALEPYREKLTKRLEGQLVFLDALDTAKKTKSTAALFSSLDKIEGRKKKELEAAVRKLDLGKGGLTTTDNLDNLFEAYSDSIEPDPEEIFHSTIKKLNVQYVCSFEAESDSEDDEDRSKAPETSSKSAPAKGHKKE